MALSYIEVTLNAERDISLPFSYLNREHVFAELVNALPAAPTPLTFAWVTSSLIRLNVAQTGTVKVYRKTPRDQRSVVFNDRNMRPEYFNSANLQNLYVMQEAADNDTAEFSAATYKALADAQAARDAAQAHVTTAAGHATTASNKATEAANKVVEAQAARDAAGVQKGLAETAATNAAASANTATSKALEAATSATDAAAARAAAITAKNDAQSAAASVGTSKTDAQTAATNAQNSALAADASEKKATTKASEAAASAAAAQHDFDTLSALVATYREEIRHKVWHTTTLPEKGDATTLYIHRDIDGVPGDFDILIWED